MTELDDGRISKFQRKIYDWLKELYPTLPMTMEKLIPSSNQRIDIYVDILNLAVECDGTFHDKPSSFYVKNEAQWRDIVQRDKRKEEDLANAGIKLVRIPYNHKFKIAKDLEIYINKVPYPDIEFDDSIFETDSYEERFQDKAKEFRKNDYREFKNKNASKIKSDRKEAYQQKKLRDKEYFKNLKQGK